jgi:transposase
VLRIVVEIMRKPAGQHGFAVLPRRWVVERTLAWLTAHRRLARDYERLPEHAEAWVKWAVIGSHDSPAGPCTGRQPWR